MCTTLVVTKICQFSQYLKVSLTSKQVEFLTQNVNYKEANKEKVVQKPKAPTLGALEFNVLKALIDIDGLIQGLDKPIHQPELLL